MHLKYSKDSPNNTGNVVIPPDFSCVWETNSYLNVSTNISTHSIYDIVSLFYFQKCSNIDSCIFESWSIFEYYKGVTIALINLIVLILFGVIGYRSQSNDIYIKQLATLKKYNIDLPYINISFDNMLKNNTQTILREIVSGLYYLKSRGKTQFNHDIDEKISHIDYSYFEKLNSFELGFLQHFFIDTTILFEKEKEIVLWNKLKKKEEEEEEKEREEKRKEKEEKEKEQGVQENDENESKEESEEFNLWDVNKWFFDQLYAFWFKRLLKSIQSTTMKNFVLMFLFCLSIFTIIVLLFECLFIFLRFFALGKSAEIIWKDTFVVVRMVIYLTILVGMGLIFSFFFIFTIFYGDIFEENLQDFFTYQRYMCEKYHLLKEKKSDEKVKKYKKDETKIITKSISKGISHCFEKMWYNVSEGTWSICFTFLCGYLMIGVVLILLLLIIVFGSVIYLVLFVLVFIIILVAICFYCFYLPTSLILKRILQKREEEFQTSTKSSTIKKSKQRGETIKQRISNSFCFCSCLCLCCCSPIGCLFRGFQWIIDSNRKDLFFKLIFNKVNHQLSKTFKNKNRENLIEKKTLINSVFKEIDNKCGDVDVSTENSVVIEINEVKKRKPQLKEIYNQILSFNYQYFLYQQSKTLYNNLQNQKDSEEKEFDEKTIKDFQFKFGKWFCKQVFMVYPLEKLMFEDFFNRNKDKRTSLNKISNELKVERKKIELSFGSILFQKDMEESTVRVEDDNYSVDTLTPEINLSEETNREMVYSSKKNSDESEENHESEDEGTTREDD